MKIHLIWACAALAGCSVAPVADSPQTESCTILYQKYDRAVRLARPMSIAQIGFATFPEEDETMEETISANNLRRNGCLSEAGEIADPGTAREQFAPFRAGDSGARVAPVYLHLGIVPNTNTGVETLRRTVSGMGYRVRTRVASGLGMRFFVGPLRSEGAIERATGLAAALGFESVYTLRVIP